MLLPQLDATQVFTLVKGVRGRCPFPPARSLILYYRYALTLPIAKPDPASAWHSELNTSLGTTTQNHDSEPPKSIRCEGSGGAAPGNTLNKALQTLLVSITFYISEGVRTWLSVINQTYSSLFWDTGLQGGWLLYQQHKFDRSHVVLSVGHI